MSVFHFTIRPLNDTRGGNAHHLHDVALDHPEPTKDRIRVERDPQNLDQFHISATLDNKRLQRFHYSVSVWCGDARVCEIHNEEAVALPGQWFPVCTVDLRESLARMENLQRDAFLRVHLNVSFGESVPHEPEGPHEPWERRHQQVPRVIGVEKRANTTTDVAIFCLLCVTFVGKMARSFCGS
ncbi:hypothetical protein ACHAXT_004308 [Thalassiosira profunda]